MSSHFGKLSFHKSSKILQKTISLKAFWKFKTFKHSYSKHVMVFRDLTKSLPGSKCLFIFIKTTTTATKNTEKMFSETYFNMSNRF